MTQSVGCATSAIFWTFFAESARSFPTRGSGTKLNSSALNAGKSRAGKDFGARSPFAVGRIAFNQKPIIDRILIARASSPVFHNRPPSERGVPRDCPNDAYTVRRRAYNSTIGPPLTAPQRRGPDSRRHRSALHRGKERSDPSDTLENPFSAEIPTR